MQKIWVNKNIIVKSSIKSKNYIYLDFKCLQVLKNYFFINL